MHKVISIFTDLQDNNYKYAVGDVYPRKGYVPTADRIAELASDKNKRKRVLIKEMPEIDEKTADFEDSTVSVDENQRKPKNPKKGVKKQNKE